MADDLVVKLTAQYSELKAGMEQSAAAVSSAVGKMTSSFERMRAKNAENATSNKDLGLSFDDLKDRVKSVVEIFAIWEGLQWAKEGISSALEFGEQMKNMALETGISAHNLQILQFAAAATGSQFDRLTMFVTQLRAKVATTAGVAILKGLGLEPSDLSNSYASLLKIGDKLNQLGPASAQAAVLMREAGGRMGVSFIPVLSNLREFQDQLEKTGLIVSDTMIAALDKTQEAWNVLGFVWKQDKEILVAEMTPAIEAAANILTTLLTSFGQYIQTSGGIEQASIKIGNEMVTVAEDVVSWLIPALATLISVLEDVGSAAQIVAHPFASLIGGMATLRYGAATGQAVYNEVAGIGSNAAKSSGLVKELNDSLEKTRQSLTHIGDTKGLNLNPPTNGPAPTNNQAATQANKAAKDTFANDTELMRLDEAEHEKNTELKIADEQKLYLEATRLFGATSIEARKQYVEVTKAKDEQANEIQRIALNSAQNEASIAEATTRAQIAEAQRTAKAKEDLLHKQGSAKGADPKAFAQAEIEAAQIETQAQMDATNAEYQDKLKGYDNELGILRLNETANKESIEKIIAEKRKAEIEWNAEKQKITQDGLLKEQQIQEDAAKKVQQTWEQTTVKIEDSFEGLFDKMLTATNKGTDKISIIWKKFTQDLSRDALEAGIFGGGGGTIGASIFGQKGQGGGLIGAGQTLLSNIPGLGGLAPGGGKDAAIQVNTTTLGTNTQALVANTSALSTKSGASAVGGGIGNSAGVGGSGAASGASGAAGQQGQQIQQSLSHIDASTAVSSAAGTLSASLLSSGNVYLEGIGLAIEAGNAILQLISAFSAVAASPSIFGNKAMGGGIVPSAMAGMLVPGGAMANGGQVSILHPREMVLPRNLSEGIQNAIDDKGTLGGKSGDMHFHVHAIDTKDFKDHLSDHGNHIADIMSRQVRLGKYAGRR